MEFDDIQVKLVLRMRTNTNRYTNIRLSYRIQTSDIKELN